MKVELTPGQNRYLALALLILVLTALIVALALPTWRLHQHYDRHIEDYADQLARYRRIAAMRPDVEAAILEADQRDSRKYYLKASLPTLAGAELQGLVTKIVESRQGRIVSSQILQGKDEGKTVGPAKVTLSVQMTASIVPLQMILHSIETQEPTLFIEQLTVRTNQGRGYKPTPGVQPEFFVQLTVNAYMPAPGARP